MPYMSQDLYTKNSYILDVATELKSKALTTATTTTPALLVEGFTKDFNLRAVVNSDGYTGYTAGTNQWTVAIEAAGAVVTAGVSNPGAFTPIVPATAISDLKQTRTFGLTGTQITDIVPNAVYYRAVITKMGTAGNVSLGVHLTKGASVR